MTKSAARTIVAAILITITGMTRPSVAQGVMVHHLGTDNTLVRICEPEKYLLFPVQETMPDSQVDILVNGEIVRTIYVRLADSRVDYMVPLELAEFTDKGKVLLNIVSEVDRTNSRDASEFVCWEEMRTADSFDTANREKYRPAFHHTPLYGWMNDPNGMFYKDGVWHLYFQHNPYGSKWQNMTWGHSVSTDLVHWTQTSNAIVPNGLGAIFSGSSVVDYQGDAGYGKGSVISIYTSAGNSQIQSLAYSTDEGMTFTNYPGNPVIANSREARDPNMFWHEATGRWILLLANAQEQEMLFYSSKDLKEWTYESSFGKGYGSQYGVWECPDFFELPIEGSNKSKWVLICNINPGGPWGGSATQYFVGNFDGHNFKCDSPMYVSKWLDYGKDHYAAVSWSNAPDKRRTIIGWMSNWQYANDVPTLQFRSANTLPRDLSLYRDSDGEYYLSSLPSPELSCLRAQTWEHHSINLDGESASFDIPELCEIDLEYSGLKGELEIVLQNSLGECVTMTMDPSKKEFAMDRKSSGNIKFSKHFPIKTIAPTHNGKGSGHLRIFIDRCSIEAFDGAGHFAMTNLVFPTEPYSRMVVKTVSGKTKIPSIKIYSLNNDK